MKGRMKKAFTALLAATVLVGGMPVNMQANVITETEKTESASEKVNEKYADTEELDLMDRERQETQAGEYGAARVGRNRTARHRRTVRGDRAARHRRTAGGDRAARHRNRTERNRTVGNGRRNRRTGRNFNQGGRK